MEFRNPVFSRADESAIDMEVNHPDYGWIPTTTSPNDVEEQNRELFAAALAAGNVGPYVPPEQPAPSIDEQITNAPDDLFGGPTLGEVYDGN